MRVCGGGGQKQLEAAGAPYAVLPYVAPAIHNTCHVEHAESFQRRPYELPLPLPSFWKSSRWRITLDTQSRGRTLEEGTHSTRCFKLYKTV
eukprot:375631-Amphidinium_carterae.1